MSYGSASGVAALSALWTSSGLFTTSTTPTLATVNEWLDDVSQVMDTALEDEGFSTPVTLSTVTKEIGMFVNGIVKDLCDYSHGAGRFFSERAIEAGYSPFITIDRELHAWVQRKAVGFENQGLTRSNVGRKVASFDLL